MSEAVLTWSDLQTIFFDDNLAGDGEEGAVELFCFNCRCNGHTEAHCPQPRRCFICLKTTHQGYQCTENPAPGSSEYKAEERCTTCNERGHAAQYCKSPGGAMHRQHRGRQVTDTVFPKPLILHVPRDSGPSEAEVQECRGAIVQVLKRLRHPLLSQVGSSSLRDVEFFKAVLPILRDPHSELSSYDRETIKGSLFRMRGAVAGSITLGEPSSSRKGGSHTTKAPGSTIGEDGDMLHDMRTSGLDINIVFGGRLEVFRRIQARKVPGGGSAVAERSDSGGRPNANRGARFQPSGGDLDPNRVIESYVYLQHVAQQQATQRRVQSSPKGKKGQNSQAAADANKDKLQRLEKLLEQQANQPASASPAVKRSVPQPPPTTSKDSTAGLQQAQSLFVAPLPPHMQLKDDVSTNIMQQWVHDGVGPREPKVAKGKSSDASDAGGDSQSTTTGAVRRFLTNAPHASSAAVQRWSSDRPISAPSSRRENQGLIENWNSYVSQQVSQDIPLFQERPLMQPKAPPSTSRPLFGVHRQQPTAPTDSSSRKKDSMVMNLVDPDLIGRWKLRFDRVKANDATELSHFLTERAVHRHIVATDEGKLKDLSNTLTSNATSMSARMGTFRKSAAVGGLSQRRNPGGLASKGAVASEAKASVIASATSMWTHTCRTIASQEAEKQLRKEIAKAVEAHANRLIHATTDAIVGQQMREFVDELIACVLDVGNQTDEQVTNQPGTGSNANSIVEEISCIEQKFANKMKSVGDMRKVCSLAKQLLLDMDGTGVSSQAK